MSLRINPSPISDMPTEIILHAMHFLRPEEVSQCARVCRAWNEVSEELWKNFCKTENLAQYKTAFSSWKKTYIVYSGKMRLDSIASKEPEMWQAHAGRILCFLLHGTTLISGSVDGKIKFWDLSKKKHCIKTIDTLMSVYSLQLNDTTLFSGTGHGKIQFWDLTSDLAIYDPVKTLQCSPGEPVHCLQLEGITLASLSYNIVQIWNISSGECLKTFIGQWTLKSMQFEGTTLVTCCRMDGKIQIWDMSTSVCKATLHGSYGLGSVQFEGTTLLSGSYKTITLWDLSTKKDVKTLKGHADYVTALQRQGKILVSKETFSTIKIWDISTWNCIKTLEEKCERILFRGMTLVCGTKDGEIKIWKELF